MKGHPVEVVLRPAARTIGAPWVRRVIRKTLAAEKVKDQLVSVLVTGNREIRRLNKQHLGHDYATDVISFSFKEGHLVSSERGFLGEVVVSAQTAKSVSRKLELPFREEKPEVARLPVFVL